MSYIVPCGKDFQSILTAPSGIAVATHAIGDILTNDKVAIEDAIPRYSQGNGSCVIKGIHILEYDSNGSPELNKGDIDVVIFNNLSTVTLGVGSGGVFTLGGSNTLDNISGVTSFVGADYKNLGVNYAHARKAVEIPVQAIANTQYSFSYALVAREEIIITATISLKVRFDIERN
jgi:hypothetical protein